MIKIANVITLPKEDALNFLDKILKHGARLEVESTC